MSGAAKLQQLNKWFPEIFPCYLSLRVPSQDMLQPSYRDWIKSRRAKGKGQKRHRAGDRNRAKKQTVIWGKKRHDHLRKQRRRSEMRQDGNERKQQTSDNIKGCLPIPQYQLRLVLGILELHTQNERRIETRNWRIKKRNKRREGGHE